MITQKRCCADSLNPPRLPSQTAGLVKRAGTLLMESGTLSIRDVPVIGGGGVALLGSHMFP